VRRSFTTSFTTVRDNTDMTEMGHKSEGKRTVEEKARHKECRE